MFKEYNMNQLILPLDLEITLQENDIAFSIHHLVESIPNEAFAPFVQTTGCPSYHPRMMLKIILCGYTQSSFSGRKIEDLVQDSIRMRWLAQGYTPSYRTINRFRVHPTMKELIRACFVQFRCQLVEEQLIDEDAIFIDGTKIEANANKFTFVWKNSIKKYEASIIEKSNKMYSELLEHQIIPELARENDEQLSIEELTQIATQLEEVVEDYTQRIDNSTDAAERKQLRSERKEPKKMIKQLKEWVERREKYARDHEILENRNSYSKTDTDATFMRMKDDYMQNGQLKAGYNIQLATQGQYAVAYDIYPNPTDTKTLIPFLNTIEEKFMSLPKYIVADAGYGSEKNYEDVLNQRECEALIPYGMYRKEQSKKYKENPFQTSHWPYNEEQDAYTCPNGKQLVFTKTYDKTDEDGFTKTLREYVCESCDGCPFRSTCTKAEEGKHRTMCVNKRWEQQKEYVRNTLSEAKMSAIYSQRKIDVEPVFGFLKANLGFTRFSVRGKAKVETEIGLALMAVNLRKYRARPGQIVRSNTSNNAKNVKSTMRFHIFCVLKAILSQPL